MSRRDREKRPARRACPLPPKRTFLLFCEGEVTEPEYFEACRRWFRNPRVQVKVAGEHGEPLGLVRRAIRERDDARRRARAEGDENLAYDEVWCISDVDRHHHLNDARQLAAARGIELAVTNPCFELWVLLHFRDSPGARSTAELPSLLAAHLPGYEKHLDADKVLAGYEAARVRAERMERDAAAMGEPGRNPSTTVHHLTERIRTR